MLETGTMAADAGTASWLDRFLAAQHDREPVSATFIGVHDRDHLLPDYSEAGAGAVVAEMRALLDSLPDAAADQAPSAADRIDLRLARGHLRIRLAEYESLHFHRGNPSVYTSEAIFGVLSLFLTDFAPIESRARSAIERLQCVPDLLAQGRANVRVAPAGWTERALRECTGALAFLGGGVDMLIAENAIACSAGLHAAAEVAADAFTAYAAWLEDELSRRVHDGYHADEGMLALCIAEGHCLDDDADGIARYAESELEVAKALVEARVRALGRDPTEDVLVLMADVHETVAGYYARYGLEWRKTREAADRHDLLTWPDFPIRYVPRPGWVREAAPHLYFLYYRSPAAFARPPVHDYLVTPIDDAMPADEQARLLRENNDSVIRLNHVIHHGGIGHHVQNWHAFRAPSRIARIAAVDCASRTAMLCAGTMAEGWACYATDLMSEIGFLTPLEQVAEARSRVRMCARAIVDVRLHQRRMTLDEAADFYRQHAGMSASAAHVEAVKNSMNPGAALMYLYGRDAIHALRARLSSRPGFDLREFHDRFLSFGSIPVSLIAAAMTEGTMPDG